MLSIASPADELGLPIAFGTFVAARNGERLPIGNAGAPRSLSRFSNRDRSDDTFLIDDSSLPST